MLALPTLLVSIDVFVMLLALPRISVSLHATSSAQLWIMDIYSFMTPSRYCSSAAIPLCPRPHRSR